MMKTFYIFKHLELKGFVISYCIHLLMGFYKKAIKTVAAIYSPNAFLL